MENNKKENTKYNGFWKWYFYFLCILLIITIIVMVDNIENYYEQQRLEHCQQAFKCYDIGDKKHSCSYCIDSECKKTGKVICYY